MSSPLSSAILPNGARVTRLNAAGPIVIYNFLYQDDEFQIRFTASRWGQDRRPSDTWHVNFSRDLADPREELKSRLGDAELVNIVKNIRCALLEWPPAKAGTSVKVTNVAFGLMGWVKSRSHLFRFAD